MRTEIFLLAVVVMAAGCTQSSTSGDASPSGQDAVDTNTVYHTSSGFQPSAITVETGETVTWVNNASSQMWVGSDRHPTHTNYAGSTLRQHCRNGQPTSQAFDQCSTGDRFSFTFQKTGTWSYHNHVNPAESGKVIVR